MVLYSFGDRCRVWFGIGGIWIKTMQKDIDVAWKDEETRCRKRKEVVLTEQLFLIPQYAVGVLSLWGPFPILLLD